MDIQAELISIGSELLCGRTLNTHGRDLGAALAAIGLELVRDTTVQDDIPAIGEAVGQALGRSGLVFASGGLGPTADDTTREALARLLGRGIVPHRPTVERLEAWFAARGRTLTPAGERQALVLEGAAVLPNPVGAAPGQRIDLPPDKMLFVLPGPPAEFNAILAAEIVPWLKARHGGAQPKLVRTVRTRGIGESDIVTRLDEACFRPTGIALGFYPAQGRVEIRLAAPAGCQAAIDAAEQALLGLLGTFLDPGPPPSP